MILRFLLLSLCILAPFRNVQAGNYYKSFAHTILESLPDTVKRRLSPVFSQIVQECAQFESDRYENPELTGNHFDFGFGEKSDSLMLKGNLIFSLLVSYDSLRYYIPLQNQKKIVWYIANLIHFGSELALPHRIHSGFLNPRIFSQVALSEDEKLNSRNSEFNFSVIRSEVLAGEVTPKEVISTTLLKNRQISSEILKTIKPADPKKDSYSPDRRHKIGKQVMLSLYTDHQEQFSKLVSEAQQATVVLLVSAFNCNQTVEKRPKK